jgi:hypothetical protein
VLARSYIFLLLSLQLNVEPDNFYEVDQKVLQFSSAHVILAPSSLRSSMVEQSTLNRLVGGSSPLAGIFSLPTLPSQVNRLEMPYGPLL